MRVLFTRNIGAVDAVRYGVPFGQCRAGDEATVSPQVSEELLLRGLALQVAIAPVEEKPPTTEAEQKPVQKPKAGQKPAETHKGA